jgi:hypothetical protein
MTGEFRRDLYASMRLAMEKHGIDFIPGAADLGDFDATSTTIGVAPGGELERLPQPALRRTFERYWEEFAARRDGRKAWEAYTPYELRTVGTFVRLGWRERAHELLDFFLRDRRPAEWNGWGEVVWRDPRAPKFIGDMPHAWVGSDYLRSVLDMFAYVRESDSTLVVGAGVAPSWLEGPGVTVEGLFTEYGALDLAMRRDGDAVRVRIGAARGVTLPRALRVPPGGIELRPPLAREGDAPRTVEVDGRPVPIVEGAVRIRRLPAEVVLR